MADPDGYERAIRLLLARVSPPARWLRVGPAKSAFIGVINSCLARVVTALTVFRMAVNPFKPTGNVARQLRLLDLRNKAKVAALKERKALEARAAKAAKLAKDSPAEGSTPAA